MKPRRPAVVSLLTLVSWLHGGRGEGRGVITVQQEGYSKSDHGGTSDPWFLQQ